MVIYESFEDNVLTEKILMKARADLGETEAVRKKCLKELKDLLKSEPDLVCNLSDTFLLQFLRHQKFNSQAAFSSIKRYYCHRLQYPSLYHKYVPSENERVMQEDIMTFLPTRDQNGCAIWAVRLGLWNTRKKGIEEILRYGLMCQEMALRNPLTQINGIVSILDLKEFSWAHVFSLPISWLRCSVSALQDCLPIRHKAVHIINHPGIFKIIYSLLQPLIKSSLRKRIHFHSDLSSFHAQVSPDILPSEFGGSKGQFRNEKFYQMFMDHELVFEETSKYGYHTLQNSN